LDAEVLVARERLVDLRAAAKTCAIAEQQDLLEEHAVASALQGLSMGPEPDRKPSAEEKDERDSKPSADEEDRKKTAAEQEEESGKQCIICIDAPKAVALVPCGHKCVCEACAERIKVGDLCPVCRSMVQMKFRVYD